VQSITANTGPHTHSAVRTSHARFIEYTRPVGTKDGVRRTRNTTQRFIITIIIIITWKITWSKKKAS